jgi:diguanylate cyclase (GGDEF)-like protein/PAS domain S-box-containing protein
MTAARPPEPGLTMADLARAWANVVSQGLPMSVEQASDALSGMVNRLATAIAAVPVDRQAAIEVAEELVTLGLTGSSAMGHGIEVLAEGLPRLADLREVSERDTAIRQVVASVAGGYAEALRRRTLTEQELSAKALLMAKQQTELELRICETRFREIFSTSAVGLVISTFDGTVVTANPAFAEIVGRSPVDIIGAALPDLLQAHSDTALAGAYRRLVNGELTRFRHRREFTTATGEVAWTHIGVSLLHDADRVPTHFLTVVENVTELQLLRQELFTQALHDVITGLPNEQYLISRLQEVLGTAGPSTMVTLYRVNLDNFSVITDGIDRRAGEALLRSVAGQLTELVAGQQAMVARLGADDFAILIENCPDRFDPREFASRINERLCEPFYVDERRGLAVSAGVGVVHLPARGLSPAELLRAADTTLHEAKRTGAGQWALYDASADARQRERFQLAAEMPGSFENGEIRPRYQPIYGLDNGWIVALQALLRWERGDGTVIDHHECVALAERTGLVIDLGRWLVQEACHCRSIVAQCPTSGEPLMKVDLTEQLSRAPDLLEVLNNALSVSGLPASYLRVGVPLTTLTGGRGNVVGNVSTLAELGVEVVLLGAAAGLGSMAFLEDLPVRAVEIAPEIVARIAQRPGNDSLVARELRQAIPLVHSVGATVIVPGVDTPEQLRWWRDAGADTARGAHFGPPVWDHQLPSVLTPAFLNRRK